MNEMIAMKRMAGNSVLERIRDMLPEIAARADEIEKGERVPRDLLDKLETAGAFRLCVPKLFGGEEMTQSAVGQIIQEIAQADASVAWHLMVAAGSQVITARLPLQSLRHYYGNGPDIWPKTSAAPKGMATEVEGGYRLSGRWTLASGARAFEWICLGFFVRGERGPKMLPNGVPDFRICLVPRGDATIIETWDAVGMRGTRSDDIVVTDLFVPEAWQASLFGPSSVKAPTIGISMPCATAVHHLAIVKGVLRGAVADLAEDSLVRRPAFNPGALMKDDPVFRTRFGEIASRVDALCSLADMCTTILETCDREGRDVTAEEGPRLSSGESLVHQDATVVMDQIMMLSGTGGVLMANRQQRRWRDLRCVAQHVAGNIGNYAGYAVSLIEQATHRAAAAA